MGATRVTSQEIVEMHRLYAAMGREMGRSGSTVARYIRIEETPAIVKHTFTEIVREQ